MESQGFRTSYRSLEIRFHIDSSRLNNSKRTMSLRCVAIIDKIPLANKESRIDVKLQTRDETMYDKIYSFSSGECKIFCNICF